MSQAPKVSVLVPIFRVEKYLRQCVDSLIQQTLTDIEIILIDDGSDDACPQICDEYAEADPRVRVIHKANSGYGASMNQGLKLASGDFVGIVESDDWVDANMFEELYNLAVKHEVNVVRSNFYQYTDAEGDLFMPILPGHDYNKVINPREKIGVFYCQPTIWALIYRRSFLTEAHIDFLESPGASFQDTAFNFKVWAMAKRAWFTTNAYYHYRCDHLGSSVKSQGKVFCVADEWQEIERYLEQYPDAKRGSYVLRNHIKLGNYKWNLERLTGKARKDFQQLFSREYKEALKNDGLCKEYFSERDWKKLMKIIYCAPFEYQLHRLGTKLSRLFVKSKVREGKRKYSVLGGIVRYEREIEHALYPIWEEETQIKE